jgi:glycogen synthase
MRVLTVSNLYPPHALGGYEMSCADVMDRFSARGLDVHVLTTTTRLDGVNDPAPDQAITVDRALDWYWQDHVIRQPGRWRARRIDGTNRRRLRQSIERVRPDVVSVWAMGGMSLGLLDTIRDSAVPSVWMVCDEWPIYGPKLDAWAAARGRPAPEPGEATICWVSGYIRDRVRDVVGWRPAHQTVTGSGIDPRDFPVRPRTDRPWRWRLLCVGRVEPRKGFTTAVEALARLPQQATLRIAGPDDGAHAADLHRIAVELGVGDRLTIAPVPRDQLAAVYADADAVLFTSGWKEPFGLVPIEAMACATPVVAAPTGGAVEFLDDGINCLAVPPKDTDAVVAALVRLADDAPLRNRLVEGGQATASTYTVDRLADLLERWHRAAAARFADGEPA